MEQPQESPGRGLDDTVPLEDVRPDLEGIEGLDRCIGDLTAVLRARLTPEDFRLVWELRDTVERLAIAEGLLRQRRLADELMRHLPCSSAAIRAVRRHLSGGELAVDDDG